MENILLIPANAPHAFEQTEDDIVLELERDEVLEDDYEPEMVDEGDEEDEDLQEDNRVRRGGKAGRRGPDLDWQVADEYENKEQFDTSEWKEKIKEFTLKSGKFTDIETYYCKFDRKKGYKCAVKFRVRYSNNYDHVSVETEGGEHTHELEEAEQEEGHPNYLRWTVAQSKIVMTGVMNQATPTVIRRNLRPEFLEGKLPTANQLSNKIAHCRKLLSASKSTVSTGDLREFITQRLEVPLDRHQMYVAFHEVVNDQGEDNIRFTLVLATPAMKARLNSDLLQVFIHLSQNFSFPPNLTLAFQDDATYRLNWHGFPVFISGCSTSTGKFFPTHTTLQSHEDTRAYRNVYNYVKEEVGTPRFRMGDGAKEITAAGEQVSFKVV